MAGIREFVIMKPDNEQILSIKDAFQKMKGKEDFLRLLNLVKPIIYGPKSVPFEMKHLRFHSNPKANRRRYNSFAIPKKAGGTRTIHSPNPGLKAILKCLNLIFQCVYEPHKAATGFVLDKSIVTNAKQHAGSLYVYNIDLKDFFPSIEQARFWGRLKYPPFNLNEESGRLEIANVIGGLCFQEMEVERLNKEKEWIKEWKNVLPQGAPTSPTITNIICERLDFYLTAVAKRFGLKYSRYADDITFSSMHNVYQGGSDFLKELHRIIEEQGFYVKESKVRLQRAGHRQEVTGLIVNEKPNVNKRYIKRLRMWLYLWEHYGHARAEQMFIRDYIGDKGHLIKYKPNMANVIWGKLEYLKMVKGTKDYIYIGLSNRFLKMMATNVPAKEIEDVKKIVEPQAQNATNQIKDSRKAKWITPEEYKEVITSVDADELIKTEYQKAFEQIYNLTEGDYQYFKKSGEQVATMTIEILDNKFVVSKFQLSDLDDLPDSVKTAENFEERLNSQVLCPNRGLINSKEIVALTILENFGNAFGGIFKLVDIRQVAIEGTIKVDVTSTSAELKTILKRDILLKKGTIVPSSHLLPNSLNKASKINIPNNPIATVEFLKLFKKDGSGFKELVHDFDIDEKKYFEIVEKVKHHPNFIYHYYKQRQAGFTYLNTGIQKEVISLIDLFENQGKEYFNKTHQHPLNNDLSYTNFVKPFKQKYRYGSGKEYSKLQFDIKAIIKKLSIETYQFQFLPDERIFNIRSGFNCWQPGIYQGLSYIFSGIRDHTNIGGRIEFHSSEKIIQIESSQKQVRGEHKYTDVSITDTHSVCLCSKEMLLENLKESGAFKYFLRNNCDWTIECDFSDGTSNRINLLSLEALDEVVPSSQKIEGFRHILRFYDTE